MPAPILYAIIMGFLQTKITDKVKSKLAEKKEKREKKKEENDGNGKDENV